MSFTSLRWGGGGSHKLIHNGENKFPSDARDLSVVSSSGLSRNDGVLSVSPPTGSAGPWSMGHISLPYILELKLGGLIILLKMGSLCVLFNLEG